MTRPILPLRMRAAPLFLPLLVAFFATSCADVESVGPVPASRQVAQTQDQGTQEVFGQTGEGALYAMYVPDAWNGSLVLYAHGYNAPTDPPLDDENLVGIRTALNDLGYAVAYSGWSETGWAVLDGIRRTHQLVGLFTARFQRPHRVYLVGRSLGSLVVVSLAETHPTQYDGVLPVCGFLGGAQAFMDHILNVRLLFDFYYPGVLPGDPMESPPVDAGTMISLAQAAMVADLTGAVGIANVMAAIGLPLPVVPGSPVTLIGSILNALGYGAGGFDELMARMQGHVPFDNWNTDYVIPEVQAGIPRYRGHPAAMNYMQRAYQPNGHLRIPMVALDMRWDPVAPAFHKERYEQLLTATGAQDLMARITLTGYGHCPDTADPTVAAFQQLATWVESGLRP